MDVALLSVAFSQAKVKQDVSIALMIKTMDQIKTEGAALTKLMESTQVEQLAQPYLGSNIDLKL